MTSARSRSRREGRGGDRRSRTRHVVRGCPLRALRALPVGRGARRAQFAQGAGAGGAADREGGAGREATAAVPGVDERPLGAGGSRRRRQPQRCEPGPTPWGWHRGGEGAAGGSREPGPGLDGGRQPAPLLPRPLSVPAGAFGPGREVCCVLQAVLGSQLRVMHVYCCRAKSVEGLLLFDDS